MDTARLHLRPPVEQDAAAIISIAGDWEVARRLARVLHPYTDTDVRFFLDHVVPNEPTWARQGATKARAKGATCVASMVFMAAMGAAFWIGTVWASQSWFSLTR